MLKEIIKNQLSDAKSLIYCINIYLKSGQILNLTNASKVIKVDGERYLPNSGLEIEEIYFDDSGQNHILISGIYEKNAIEINTNLIDSKFSVNLLSGNTLHNLVIYSCNEITRGDLDFLIRLESQIHKYNRQAALIFSKTCRAHLGDNKCGVNLEELAEYYDIMKIEGKKIYLKQPETSESIGLKRSGYFNAGKLIFIPDAEDSQISSETYFIISHNGREITLGKNISHEYQSSSIAKILPGCDKKFITCCKKFDNALNFRGEPFVPEFNKLEN